MVTPRSGRCLQSVLLRGSCHCVHSLLFTPAGGLAGAPGRLDQHGSPQPTPARRPGVCGRPQPHERSRQYAVEPVRELPFDFESNPLTARARLPSNRCRLWIHNATAAAIGLSGFSKNSAPFGQIGTRACRPRHEDPAGENKKLPGPPAAPGGAVKVCPCCCISIAEQCRQQRSAPHPWHSALSQRSLEQL